MEPALHVFVFVCLICVCIAQHNERIPSKLVQGTIPNFGTSLSFHNDCVLVGAFRSSESITNAGAAHIYCNNGSNWQLRSRLVASNGASADDFGFSVALSESVAVVGARNHDDNAENSGAAYVFRRTGTTWTETQYITAFDQDDSDYFGYSVSLSDEWLLVGSPRRDDAGTNSGSVYLYRTNNNGLTWGYHSKLTAGGSYSVFIL